ncbi:hypothetical protein SEA_ATUIN_281 [Arthrobacter phage Atuin]|nr:hypothetical protein SEA_ATUIN_80 [Arthrobacter phage Atuin]
MATIRTPRHTEVSGFIEIYEDSGPTADVYLRTAKNGMSCKLSDVRDIIEELVKVAGFKSEPTGNGMGLIIQFPESPAVQERREELAWKFFDTCHDRLENGQEHAIEYIIDGEKQRGELK